MPRGHASLPQVAIADQPALTHQAFGLRGEVVISAYTGAVSLLHAELESGEICSATSDADALVGLGVAPGRTRISSTRVAALSGD